MGADVESDFKVGSPITFRGEFKGKTYQDKGEIKAATRGKRLELRAEFEKNWAGVLAGLTKVVEES